ncbi:MAG: B12-binding domain-containing radical SAM protein, partial [Candidatus Binatia bacterium]
MFARIAKPSGGFAPPAIDTARPDAGLPVARSGRRTLRVYFIKPSRYDDAGLVLAYRWGVIPNNTLIALAGLNAAYAAAHPEIDVQTVIWDEMVDGVISAAVVASIDEQARADGVDAIIGLAGVQTNQYPRGRDLALQFRHRGLTVLMGGFHVSSHPPSVRFLESMRVTVVLGEADATWPLILDDYRAGVLQPTYRVREGLRVKTGLDDITVPPIEAAPLPAIDDRYVGRFFNPTFSTIDTSRGCPFTCSYCSVKNVMGRTMRARDPAAVVEWMRDAYDRHGIRNLLVVDDDFYRSPRWEAILTGMAALRRTRADFSFVMQVDMEAAAHE